MRAIGDPENHGEKDHRRDQHLDQGNESVAERLESHARRRPEIAEQRAANDGAQHYQVEAGCAGFYDGSPRTDQVPIFLFAAHSLCAAGYFTMLVLVRNCTFA